ncbi:hypothetical protein ABZ865_27750 [Streptomyces sp. NPDC047085]|uniref:hypothetical protein n=1 Tax=Streptomyces sp. NPDC047085 TaxID=3155140 RepID=UPI0033C22FBB
MGSLRLTLCTGILAVAALTPAAHAADGGTNDGGVTVTPAAPAPGNDVSLRVRGCSGSQGTAVSDAFVSDARLTGAQGALGGETRVRSSLQPGAYDVRVSCAGRSFTERITVGDPSGGGRQSGQSSDANEPAAPASPFAPVHAGGGGTAPHGPATDGLAADDGAAERGAAHFATVATTGSGPDTAQAVTGLALAGCAAAAVGVLRARRSRGTD